MFVSMHVFQNRVKSRKICMYSSADKIIHMICWILDILLSFFRIFFLRGGAQNSSLPPGARYPHYATEWGPFFIEAFMRCWQFQKSQMWLQISTFCLPPGARYPHYATEWGPWLFIEAFMRLKVEISTFWKCDQNVESCSHNSKCDCKNVESCSHNSNVTAKCWKLQSRDCRWNVTARCWKLQS